MEIRDLNGLGKEFTSDITNPFYKSSLSKNKKEKPDETRSFGKIQERETIS